MISIHEFLMLFRFDSTQKLQYSTDSEYIWTSTVAHKLESKCAYFSPTTITGAMVWPDVVLGKTEASHTRNPRTPYTSVVVHRPAIPAPRYPARGGVVIARADCSTDEFVHVALLRDSPALHRGLRST
jgi:hypothetical protein